MLYVINKDNRHEFDDVLKQMWKGRHKVFIDQLGWDLETDRINEIDEFDKEDTIYLVSLDKDGGLEGSCRLLPTNEPHIMSKYFSEFCAEGVPVNDTIWEISRFYPLPAGRRQFLINQCAGELQAGLSEYALVHGITHYTSISPMAIIPYCLRIGWDIKPIGLPSECDGKLIVACKFTVTPESYQLIKNNNNISGPLIQNLSDDTPLVINA